MKWRTRAVTVVAFAYPLSLVVLALSLRYVGEQWWVTGVGLYLPRLVFAIPLPLVLLAIGLVRLYRLLWTQVIAALVLLFPLMGLVPPRLAPRGREEGVLRVLSYNINAGAGGIEKVVDQINEWSPDVVLLQEVASSETLRDLLGGRYATVQAAGQFFLASRYPASTVEPSPLDYGGRPRSARFVAQTLETPLGTIVVYNVHPISPREIFYALRGSGLRTELMSGRLFSPANGAVFKTNSGLRALQVQTFAEAAKRESAPVIIAGDTNLPSLSYVLSRSLSAYRDGFTEVGSGFGYTYPTAGRPWMRIDRILASEALRFVRFDVGSSLASDHLCVVADLERR
jgi:endonuclease/exonuclease/phosphatase family metal-dependent hydrolase